MNRRIDWTRIDNRTSRVTVTEDVEVRAEYAALLNAQNIGMGAPQLGVGACLTPMSAALADYLRMRPTSDPIFGGLF